MYVQQVVARVILVRKGVYAQKVVTPLILVRKGCTYSSCETSRCRTPRKASHSVVASGILVEM